MMDIGKAIDLLEHHNKWRKGADIPMIDPSVLSEVIDTIVKHYKRHEE